MKALSIHQPHASRIAAGQKTIEVRSWPTKHVGPLLICVTAKAGQEYAGRAICVVDVLGCYPLGETDRTAAMLQPEFIIGKHYGWRLGNVRLIVPFAVKGMQGLFSVADHTVEAHMRTEVMP